MWLEVWFAADLLRTGCGPLRRVAPRARQCFARAAHGMVLRQYVSPNAPRAVPNAQRVASISAARYAKNAAALGLRSSCMRAAIELQAGCGELQSDCNQTATQPHSISAQAAFEPRNGRWRATPGNLRPLWAISGAAGSRGSSGTRAARLPDDRRTLRTTHATLSLVPRPPAIRYGAALRTAV